MSLVYWGGAQGKFNRADDPVNIILYLIIPEANHGISLRLQMLGSFNIIFGLFDVLAQELSMLLLTN